MGRVSWGLPTDGRRGRDVGRGGDSTAPGAIAVGGVADESSHTGSQGPIEGGLLRYEGTAKSGTCLIGSRRPRRKAGPTTSTRREAKTGRW